MHSDRLFRICYILTHYGIKFGSCIFLFSRERHTCRILDDPKIISRMKRNNILFCVWALASLALVGKFYILEMTERCSITLYFWVVGVTGVVIHSVLRYFTDDMVLVTNSSFMFFRHLHSKHISSKYYLIQGLT